MRFIPSTMCFIVTLSLESHIGMTGISLGICFWVWWVGVFRIHWLVFNFRAGLYCRFSSTQSSKLNLFQSRLLATLSKRMITRHEILVARKERHSAILLEELNRNNQNAWPTIATGLWGPRSISRCNNQTARVKEVNYKHTSRQTVETFTTIFVAKILFNCLPLGISNVLMWGYGESVVTNVSCYPKVPLLLLLSLSKKCFNVAH